AHAIAQVVGFVHDDEIEAAAEEALGMFASARQSERGDQTFLVPELARVAAQQRVVSRGAGNIELGLELLPPLSDQGSGGKHENAPDHAAQQVLLENHAGLNGLAEPDFVGEQDPAAKLLEHLAHGLNLVPEAFDAAEMR